MKKHNYGGGDESFVFATAIIQDGSTDAVRYVRAEAKSYRWLWKDEVKTFLTIDTLPKYNGEVI